MDYYTLSGDVLEVSRTPWAPRSSGVCTGLPSGRWKPMNWDGIANRFFEVVYNAQFSSTASMRRSKRILSRKIWANYVKNRTTFVTLTFKKNVEDYDYAYNELKKFFKRLSYHYCNKEKRGQDFSYVVVPEQQGRGSWHYHIMLFNVPFLCQCEVKKIWGHGSVRLNGIFGSPTHASNYLMKYFVKGFNNVEYRRRYSCSQNLNKAYTTDSPYLLKNLFGMYDFETFHEIYDGYFYYGKIRLTRRC